MKTITEKLYFELNKKVIDWKSIEEYISSLGEDINLYDEKDEECILSESYKNHMGIGYINEKLTDLFVKHGFDVTANGGKNGASCLRALCCSSDDKYVLHIAEKLLNLGADSTIVDDKKDDGRGVLSSIEWKLGYWSTGEYDSANIFSAYYDMVERHQNGKKYKGIRAFREVVGETVTKVEKLKVLNDNEERNLYLMFCGDMQLIVTEYVELIVNPYVRDEALEIIDVSEEFQSIIGVKVKGLRYYNSSLAKISFDNGYTIVIGSNDFAGIDKTGVWLRISSTNKVQLPELGTSIEAILFFGICTHANDSIFYSENTVVLIMKDSAYALYSHSSRNRNSTVRVEELSKDLVAGLSRSIEVTKPTLKHVEYSNMAIKWITIKCVEGFLYIVTNHFTDLAVFMSEVELNEEDVLKVGFFTKGMKKIRFIG